MQTSMNENSLSALPLPPIVNVKGTMFPSYPEMRKMMKDVGSIFTLVIAGRRLTVIADKAAYRHVFFAKDSDEVELDSAKLAHHWFGINKEMARDYTRPGLDSTRNAMAYKKMLAANDKVEDHAKKFLNAMPESGQADLWDIAMLTFVPVVQHLFGKETFPTDLCPMIAETLWNYDHDFKKVANGVPRKYFPEMEKRAKEICAHFAKSIRSNIHKMPTAESQCPVLKARLEVLPDGKFCPDDEARFMFSVFWASQGNTIPGTFWMLALIMTHGKVLKKVKAELDEKQRNGKICFEECEYLNACVKETLRLKVANMTLRNVKKDIKVQNSSGESFRVPKNDEISVASHLQHHDESIYPDPFAFKPERWIGSQKFTSTDWFPFGAGTNMCSGRHLAQLELATVAGLFFSTFDAQLLEEIPEEDWKNCVAMVSPSQRSLMFKYTKRKNVSDASRL